MSAQQTPAEFLEQQAAPAIAARVAAWDAHTVWHTALIVHGQSSQQALAAHAAYSHLDDYAKSLEHR